MLVTLAVTVSASGSIAEADEIRKALGDDRSRMYDALYAHHKYHHDLNISHAEGMIETLISPRYAAAERSTVRFLDIGCSHGKGVELLWRAGFRASGVDLAKTAVEMARKTRHPPSRTSCVPEGKSDCFKVGSAAALPWEDGAFDAAISTDVLEHIPPALVPAAMKEFGRVVRRALFLGVAGKPEGAVMRSGQLAAGYVARLKGGERQSEVGLHETNHGPEWWVEELVSADRRWQCTVEMRKSVACSPSDAHVFALSDQFADLARECRTTGNHTAGGVIGCVRP